MKKEFVIYDKKELERCENSPVYFYNKYVRNDGQKELTEAEYEAFVKQVKYNIDIPSKLGEQYKNRPLLPSECYNEPSIKLKQESKQ